MSHRTLPVWTALIASLSLPGCVASTTVTASNSHVNRSPVISTFTANPSNEAKPGQAITFLVAANDPDTDPMQFTWSATGGNLSTNAGQAVSWTPPSTPGTFSVQVVITDGKGGAALGAQNITVGADKVTLAPPVLPSPSPAPSTTSPAAPTNGSSKSASTPPAPGTTQPSPEASPKPKFRLMKMNTGLPVRDFHAFDMNEVWATTFFQNKLLHTTDGGATWDVVTVGTKGLNGLFFQDHDHGWVCGDGGVLFSTEDGGKKWTLIDTGTSENLKSVIVKPDGTGYLTHMTCCDGDVGNSGGLLLTRDGGKTWKSSLELKATPYRFDLSPSGMAWGVGGTLIEEVKGSAILHQPSAGAAGNSFFDPAGTPWFLFTFQSGYEGKYHKLEGDEAIPFPPINTGSNIYRNLRFSNAASVGTTIVFLTDEGVFRSDDEGKTWSEPFNKPVESWPYGRMKLFGPDKGWVSGVPAGVYHYWLYEGPSSGYPQGFHRIGE